MPNEQRITPQDYKILCKILEMDGCYFVYDVKYRIGRDSEDNEE